MELISKLKTRKV